MTDRSALEALETGTAVEEVVESVAAGVAIGHELNITCFVEHLHQYRSDSNDMPLSQSPVTYRV